MLEAVDIDKRMIKSDDIVDNFEKMLRDPDLKLEVARFVKISGRLTPDELSQRFTI